MRKLIYTSFFFNTIGLLMVSLLVYKLARISNVLFKFNSKHAIVKMEHRKSQFTTATKSSNCIVFLGDSITEYGAWSELFPTYSILNRGIAGDGILGVRSRLEEINRHKPKMIFLMIGVNDLIYHSPNKVTQLYKDLLTTMKRQFQGAQIIVQSILPVNNEVYKTGINNQQIKEVNAAIQSRCKTVDLPYIGLYDEFTDNQNNLKKAYTQDGIHINGIAYTKWKEAIKCWLPIE